MQCAWNMTNEGYAAAEIPGQVIGQDLNDKQKSAITEKMAMVDKCLVSACFPADIEPAFCHHHAASWLHIVAPSSIPCVCPPSSIPCVCPPSSVPCVCPQPRKRKMAENLIWYNQP